jgi:UDP-N-acetylglucosamine:LPS N-acetylglucosamine transferase
MDAKPRVVIVSGSAGAGHDGVAHELARRLEAAGFAVARHDFLRLLPRPWGRFISAGYDLQVRYAPRSYGWMIRSLERVRPLSRAVTAASGRAGRRGVLRAVGQDPALVVSTYPLASQALGGLRRRGRLGCPVVTFLTDLSVHPLWVSRAVDVHLALHAVSARQATRQGAGAVRVIGPAVRREFAPGTAAAVTRSQVRAGLGVPGDAVMALVVAGSLGLGDVEQTVEDILATSLAVPVVVCGRNAALRDRLARRGLGVPLGWVEDMPSLVRASDVVVQNAGGLSSLEALVAGVPVITYRCLPGHGLTNARALDESGLAPWVRAPSDLSDALAAAVVRHRGPEHPVRGLVAAADPAAVVMALALGAPDEPVDVEALQRVDLSALVPAGPAPRRRRVRGRLRQRIR